jgi:(p)ppGpp synthase/HD superfamily hydrolase
MKETNLFIRARHFTRKVHKDIIIKTVSGDVRPQFEHLQEVADLVWASSGSDIEIVAAYLHDIVEDTPVKIEEIEQMFGKEVADIVGSLTDPEESKNLPTLERKIKQAIRVKNESEKVKKIKLADQISNIRFVTTDPTPDWSFEGNQNYVRGAKLIADNCKGVSTLLDEIFDSEYRKAVDFFKL